MLLIVVYVGAIAVLFLFVVMMLNVDVKTAKQKPNRNLPILILVAVILFSEILLILKFSTSFSSATQTLYQTPSNISNIKAIGNILYTDFILPFQLAGAILFVAMIGAIILTLKDETRFMRKQNISQQVARNKDNSIKIIKVKSGEGIKI
jgi:NADH-quinone oxidoreductase subunit J